MVRKLLLTSVLVLVAASCARTPSGPVRYAIDMDAKSSQKEKFQFSAYFPGKIIATAGDTLKFRNRSNEAPHTVTFGVEADRSNQPMLFTDKGENPAAFGPCDIAKQPTVRLTRCESKRLRPYDGTGYWNSGLVQARSAPKKAGKKSTEVELTNDISVGEHSFVCVLHPFMNGVVEIVEEESERTAPADVRDEAETSAEDAREDAERVKTPKLERDDGEITVSAGWGDRVVAVNRFAPERVEVKAGTTVDWKVRNPYEPHTVTFEPPKESDDLAPGGIESGGSYNGGFTSSGLLGPDEQFALTFTTPGNYEYVCLLHPGQNGVVRVTEA